MNAYSRAPSYDGLADDLAQWLMHRHPKQSGPETRKRLPVVGLCGAQGSGKSTLAGLLRKSLAELGQRYLCLSIDDLYLTGAARAALAQTVHPLFRTRGVPGTHDVVAGIDLLQRLQTGQRVVLPRFDKGRDEPMVQDDDSEIIEGQAVDGVLFEGWCVGLPAQDAKALSAPVNQLEQREDADGSWRNHVNRQLAGPYQRLFAQLDALIFLQAPDFDTVFRWRKQQESDLPVSQQMTDVQLQRFIAHYERLTRHALLAMPGLADITVTLDKDRKHEKIRLPG